jgi:hypothetical protein
VRLLVLVAALLCLSMALAAVAGAQGRCGGGRRTSGGDRCFYISYSGGSDRNSGRSEGSPWRDAPGMQGFSGRYSHRAGDHFIFEGGVTWPNSEFPMVGSGWGSPGNDDYYGDSGWHTGRTFRRPVFSAGGQMITGNDALAGASQDIFLDLRNLDYIIVRGIRFTGWTASGLSNYGSCAGIDINNQGNGGDQHITVDGVAFSGISIDETSDEGAECAAVTGYTGPPYAGDSIVEHSTFRGGNTTLGIAIDCIGNVVGNRISGMTGNIYPCGHGVIADNRITDCGYPHFPAGASGVHSDAIQSNGADGAFYIHGNVIDGTGADNNGNECESMFLGNAGETDYVWNNVLYNLHGDSPALTQNTSVGDAAYFWNNTIVGGFGAQQNCLRQGHGDPATTVWQNNLCISWAGRSVSSGAPTSTDDHNVLLTPRRARADGLTAADGYTFPPGRIPASLLGSGADLASECSGHLASLCLNAGAGARGSAAARGGSGWNVGAYRSLYR